MKLGEIKAAAMRLCHCDRQFATEDIEMLSEDPGWSDLFLKLPDAINRALADLEGRRFLPRGRVTLSLDERGKARVEEMTDLFDVERVEAWRDGAVVSDHPFWFDGSTLRVENPLAGWRYELYYHRTLPRIAAGTAWDTEFVLPRALGDALALFAASEALRVDEPNEAAALRNLYEQAVERYADGLETHRQRSVQPLFGVI